ncbi:Metallo-dependent hydrolase [Rozella allomycis CSF55]|uniref:Metallo-dependent hydrolase n=1 Tax=Rozella allomycis (strain CSF55) TaxID=988480 RepID=A0A4P9YG67_ROZAC|nr:Metallo-dependent hydrolase [Rozella allomycis CSF55]
MLSKLVDCHSHIIDHPDVFSLLGTINLDKILVMSSEPNQWQSVLKLHEAKSSVIPCLGLHPWLSYKVKQELNSFEWVGELRRLLLINPKALIGEIGIDKCSTIPGTNTVDKEFQWQCFEKQYHMAVELQRPISVHCVRQHGKLHDFLSKQDKWPPSIMLHSFGGSPDSMKKFLKLKQAKRIYFSFSQIINQRCKWTKDLIRECPWDQLLLETDLHDPTKINDAIVNIYELVAEVKEKDLNEVVEIVHHNLETFLQF